MSVTEAHYAALLANQRRASVPVKPAREWNYLRFESFTFRLPWAPSVNSCYANVTGKGRVKTTAAREYRKSVWLAVLEQRVPRRILAHPLSISITQHARDGRGDPDNGIKIVLDVMKVLDVIADDNREIIKALHVYDGARTHAPYVVVSVEPV